MQSHKLKKTIKKPLFKMYQRVILMRDSVEDIGGEGTFAKKGQKGVVLLICRTAHMPSIGYVVEFFDKKGEAVAVSTVREEDIAPLPSGYPDIKAVKSKKKSKPKARAA